MSKKNILRLLCLMVLAGGCRPDQPASETPSTAPGVVDTSTKKAPPPAPKEKPRPVVRYLAYNLDSDSVTTAFKEQFSDSKKEIIFSLNRVDTRHAYRADTLVVPDTFMADWKLYSPFPLYLKVLDSVRKMVLFSYASQAFAAYVYGELQRWGPSSMGTKRNPTPSGLHYCNWKSKKSVSTVKSEWILPWNFNIMNKEGVGWHQYDLPGYPASHSCLRLLEADAKWLYEFGEQWILKDARTIAAQGTPVLVFGEYPFDGRKPWLYLPEDPEALQVSEKTLNDLLSPLLPEILKEQRKRDQLRPAARDDEPAATEEASGTSTNEPVTSAG